MKKNERVTPMLLLVVPPPRMTILGDASNMQKKLAALRLLKDDKVLPVSIAVGEITPILKDACLNISIF